MDYPLTGKKHHDRFQFFDHLKSTKNITFILADLISSFLDSETMTFYFYRACLVIASLVSFDAIHAQELHARWDELTASDWPKALRQSDSTCILPIGIHTRLAPVHARFIETIRKMG